MAMELRKKINILDIKSEGLDLSEKEKDEKMNHELQLRNILLEHEIKMKQRARERCIIEGDENTKYFDLKENENKRRMRIIALKDNENTITNEDGINLVATKYNIGLFGPPALSSIGINDLPMEKLDHEDIHCLTAPFSMEEIKMVLDRLKQNPTPDPDALPSEFYQDFWDVVKIDIYNMFQDFFMGNFLIERLNYGLVSLIPKVDKPMDMKNFRPICFLNVSYKIITKVLNNRLDSCIDKVISKHQFGFIKNRHILDCVVALHEIVHEVKKEKRKMVLC
jgi:hypothetical protein